MLQAIANGRAWLDDIVTGRAAGIDTIAMREGRSKRSIAMMISLAFLAPTSSRRLSTVVCRAASA